MESGMGQITKIVKAIRSKQLPYTDTVLIGDNSSGKSLLLKLFIESITEWYTVYFIDAVNRGFDVKKIPADPYSGNYKQELLKTRLRDDLFNLQDSFN